MIIEERCVRVIRHIQICVYRKIFQCLYIKRMEYLVFTNYKNTVTDNIRHMCTYTTRTLNLSCKYPDVTFNKPTQKNAMYVH